MWWNKESRLNERASYNCIDLSGYLNYPGDVAEHILIAMEGGCTRHQINKALDGSSRREVIDGLIAIRTVPDVESFMKTLTRPLKNVCGSDIRENIKSLGLLLPDEKAHGWCSVKSHVTLQLIQRQAEEEPEITSLFLCFLVADWLIADKGTFNYAKELHGVIESFFDDGTETEHLCIPVADYMEVLAFYYAVSGINPGNAVELCGRTAATLGFPPRRTYHFMLETAALIMMRQKGITAGMSFLKKNHLPAQYEISQVGIRKKLHATLCQEPPLLLETCSDICRRQKNMPEVLFSNKPDRILVLACQIFMEAVTHTPGIWRNIAVSRETQQYISEILSYCNKEVIKNVWNFK